MQLRKRIKTVTPESEFDRVLEQELLSAWLELATMVNAGLGFVDNFNCAEVNIPDTGAINTEFTVTHNLKRIPSGYLVIKRDKAAVVYDSTTTWTVTSIFLKANVANCNITVIVF